MKERLFENRIADVKDDAGKYQAVVFKRTSESYEAGYCYLLSREELSSIVTSSSSDLPYIVDYSLQGLLDEVQKKHTTIFTKVELEAVLGICWITQDSVINLGQPVLVDDGHICEKDGIILCQNTRGGFVSATPLSDPSKKLSVLILHPIVPLIKNGGDLAAISQTPLPNSVTKIITFMDYVDETISRKTREISPNHPGLIRFQQLIHLELYERMPLLLRSKQEQFDFFSNPQFLRLWDNYRRMLIAIQQYGHYEKYVHYIDGYVLPLLVSFMCPRLASVVFEYMLKVGVGLSIVFGEPTKGITNFLCSHFFYPDLSGDGLDLKPFLDAMRKDLAAATRSPAPAEVAGHSHSS